MQRTEISDDNPLRVMHRPEFELGSPTLRIVDLFAGCGGLTLGVAQATVDIGYALDIALAVDSDVAAASVYRVNFPKALMRVEVVEQVFDGEPGSPLTSAENECKEHIGVVHALVGGPPCQGYSDLNNHTRRNDSKNRLYLRMARAAEVLNPRVVLLENVPTIRHDKHNVVGSVRSQLARLGYQASDRVLQLDSLGVAQKRRRHLLLATMPNWPHPEEIFIAMEGQPHQLRNLQWAIGDLANLTYRAGSDKIPKASEENLHRMAWLLEHDEYNLPNRLRPKCHQDEHSYKSMYGRLRWDEPAQTVTSGFGSIGQGRYMHPDQQRALTVHEAARIQGFPDYFDFTAVEHRGSLSTMIGNAVPPQLGKEIFSAIFMHNVRL
jgi:DNA (cytosine-5)-methyltransferase 1